MKTKQLFTKAFLLLAFTFGLQQSADAQLGGILNKAKTAVQNKVKDVSKDVKEKATKEVKAEASKAKTQAMSKALQKALGDAPDCPWVMAEDVNIAQMENLVNQLGKMNNDKTREFAAQIDARAAYDMKIIKGMDDGSLPKDNGVYEMAKKEMDNWETFFSKMSAKGGVYGPHNMKKSDEGWYQDGRVQIIIPTKNGVYVTVKKDGQATFCSLAYDAIYAEELELKDATEGFIFNLNEATLFENFASKQSHEFEHEYNRSLLAAQLIGDAIKFNKPENIERRAKPAAGSMNGAWRAKALPLAKQKDSNLVDLVITSDAWDVKTNALGVPIKRIIYGYIFYKDKNGTKASARSWAQKYQGGGKYGALANDGVGVETDFYVK